MTAVMGHADIQTTMIYAHHVPKRNAAAQFTEFVRASRQTCLQPCHEPTRTQSN
jgi:hypothetical protein